MRLIPDSGILQLRGRTQWLRCAFRDSALVDDVVSLAPLRPAEESSAHADAAPGFAGMAFDRHCRLFHPQPEAARLEFVVWGKTSQLGVHEDIAHPFAISSAANDTADHAAPLPIKRPLALAADMNDYLYVADLDELAVWVVDAWQQELARRFDFTAAPLDLAACDGDVFLLLDDGTSWQLAPCEMPQRTAWPAIAGAQRLSVAKALNGGLFAWVVKGAGTSAAQLVPLHANAAPLPVPGCSDACSSAEDAEFGTLLVLAYSPGQDFQRMRVRAYASAPLPGLHAPGYDGRGIELAPDGRIAYWTSSGLRHAAPARTQYKCSGMVWGYALDSEHDQSSWGKMVVEACMPPGTSIKVWAYSRDELDFNDAMARTPPAGEALSAIVEPGATPLLPQAAWERIGAAPQNLFRDPSQRPLAPMPEDGFALYDAPLIVPPGRYLWLAFELTGTRSKSPRLLSVRVEYPGHDLLKMLPKTLWREQPERDFLFRYLMPIAAMLDEWQGVSSQRHRLLDARIAPGEALPWLASFVGLALEPCWPERVQRRMVAAAAGLFRTRGTLPSLKTMIEILSDDAEVLIIEHYRLRGGGVFGNEQANHSQAVLGVGFRVGGIIGEAGVQALDGVEVSQTEQDFDDFAHRFTVTVSAALSEAQLTCLRHLIELHKPAHTDFTLCTAASGMRVGLGLHVGVAAHIGDSSGFEQAILGDAALGAGFLLGRAELDGSARGGDQ